MSIRKQLTGKSRLSLTPPAEREHKAPAMTHTLLSVPIALLQANPDQPRTNFPEDSIRELAESIKEKGLLQPIIVKRDGENIILVAGERRSRACTLLGWKDIPAILTTGDPAEVALIENLQRVNLSPLEEAFGMKKLMERHKYTQEELARILSKTSSTVSETLSILSLPARLREDPALFDMPKRVLVEIAKQRTDADKLALFQKVKSGDIKGEAIRDVSRKRKKKSPSSRGPLDKIKSFKEYLVTLDITKSSPEQKKGLAAELTDLNSKVEYILTLLG